MSNLHYSLRRSITLAIFLTLTVALPLTAQAGGFTSADIRKLRSVPEVAMSPDGSRIAYSIVTQDGPGRPAGDLWIMNVADHSMHKFCPANQRCSSAVWSPDG